MKRRIGLLILTGLWGCSAGPTQSAELHAIEPGNTRIEYVIQSAAATHASDHVRSIDFYDTPAGLPCDGLEIQGHRHGNLRVIWAPGAKPPAGGRIPVLNRDQELIRPDHGLIVGQEPPLPDGGAWASFTVDEVDGQGVKSEPAAVAGSVDLWANDGSALEGALDVHMLLPDGHIQELTGTFGAQVCQRPTDAL